MDIAGSCPSTPASVLPVLVPKTRPASGAAFRSAQNRQEEWFFREVGQRDGYGTILIHNAFLCRPLVGARRCAHTHQYGDFGANLIRYGEGGLEGKALRFLGIAADSNMQQLIYRESGQVKFQSFQLRGVLLAESEMFQFGFSFGDAFGDRVQFIQRLLIVLKDNPKRISSRVNYFTHYRRVGQDWAVRCERDGIQAEGEDEQQCKKFLHQSVCFLSVPDADPSPARVVVILIG